MAQKTRDEMVALCDAKLEGVMISLVNAADNFSRADGRKLIATRALRRTTQRFRRAGVEPAETKIVSAQWT